MDKEFIYFIIGCVVLAPVLFVIIRAKKHSGNSYEPPRIDDSDPTDPRSLAGIRHRINPPPG
jgi:hypothetical protein